MTRVSTKTEGPAVYQQLENVVVVVGAWWYSFVQNTSFVAFMADGGVQDKVHKLFVPGKYQKQERLGVDIC